MKTPINIRIDRDILTWFRQQGDGYQTRINDALRAHMKREMRKKRN